jgi:hypothetical protein
MESLVSLADLDRRKPTRLPRILFADVRHLRDRLLDAALRWFRS